MSENQRSLELRPLANQHSAEIAPFGPWCILHREDLLSRWAEFDFPDPFPSSEDWVQADVQCRRLANHLVPLWAGRLNARHDRSYSPAFWRVMLLNWLTVAIPPLWYRWRYTEDFIARHADGAFDVIVAPALADWQVPDSSDLIYRLMSPAGDFLATSAIVKALAPRQWRLREDPVPPVWETVTGDVPNIAETSGGRLIRRLFGRLPVATIPDIRLAKLPLSLMALPMPRHPAQIHYDFADGDVAAQFPASFLTWLDGFLQGLLPLSFRSGFAALEERALSQTYYPGRLLVDQLNAPRDSTRVVVAMAHERGERLIGSQHGGIYGTAKAMMAAAATEYPYHAYLTWGWRQQQECRGRFIPLPSPSLSRDRDRHAEADPALLFIGGTMNLRGTRLGWLPKPRQYLAYRTAKRTFLGGLSAEPLAQVRYRPYRRGHTDLPDAEYVQAAFPSIAVHTGDLQAALMRCRLAVIDHPITTMLTAMAANVPTILYWERDAWPMAEQAEPYFQRLRDAGILFHDPAAAAAQVNAVWGDVPGWWLRPEIQAARMAFAHQYARTSRWWWWHWLKALWRLAR